MGARPHTTVDESELRAMVHDATEVRFQCDLDWLEYEAGLIQQLPDVEPVRFKLTQKGRREAKRL